MVFINLLNTLQALQLKAAVNSPEVTIIIGHRYIPRENKEPGYEYLEATVCKFAPGAENAKSFSTFSFDPAYSEDWDGQLSKLVQSIKDAEVA